MHIADANTFAHQELEKELFLVSPIIPASGIAFLHGKRGLGKTQVATALANAVATGGKWMGKYSVTHGRVFYLQLDMPIRVQQERVRQLEKELGVIWGDRLVFGVEESRIDVVQTAEEVEAGRPPEWVVRLRETRPTLVVVDTLRRSHRMDENLSETAVIVYDSWKTVVGPGCTTLLLHHDRKTSEGGLVEESARGTGAWLDECNFGMQIRKRRGRLELHLHRIRTDVEERHPPIPFHLDPKSLLPVPMDPIEQWVMEAMMKGMSREKILANVTDPKEWKKPLSRATAYRRLEGYQPATGAPELVSES